MTLDQDPSEDREVNELVSKLRELGDSSGNTSLREALGWETDYYYEVRNRAEDAGLVARGRGKGGSTRIAEAAPEIEPEPLVDVPWEGRRPELSLYEPIKGVLESDWVKDSKEGPCHSLGVAEVGLQGRRSTGG